MAQASRIVENYEGLPHPNSPTLTHKKCGGETGFDSLGYNYVQPACHYLYTEYCTQDSVYRYNTCSASTDIAPSQDEAHTKQLDSADSTKWSRFLYNMTRWDAMYTLEHQSVGRRPTKRRHACVEVCLDGSCETWTTGSSAPRTPTSRECRRTENTRTAKLTTNVSDVIKIENR